MPENNGDAVLHLTMWVVRDEIIEQFPELLFSPHHILLVFINSTRHNRCVKWHQPSHYNNKDKESVLLSAVYVRQGLHVMKRVGVCEHTTTTASFLAP